jgi:hypothetical protein
MVATISLASAILNATLGEAVLYGKIKVSLTVRTNFKFLIKSSRCLRGLTPNSYVSPTVRSQPERSIRCSMTDSPVIEQEIELQ